MKKTVVTMKSVATAATGLSISLFAGLAAAGVPTSGAYVSQVPEPSAMSMIAGGAAVLVILARLKRKK